MALKVVWEYTARVMDDIQRTGDDELNIGGGTIFKVGGGGKFLKSNGA